LEVHGASSKPEIVRGSATALQYLSLFRYLVLTVVLGVIATYIDVFCEVQTKYLKLVTQQPHKGTTVIVNGNKHMVIRTRRGSTSRHTD
jgi:hypothetical protein